MVGKKSYRRWCLFPVHIYDDVEMNTRKQLGIKILKRIGKFNIIRMFCGEYIEEIYFFSLSMATIMLQSWIKAFFWVARNIKFVLCDRESHVKSKTSRRYCDQRRCSGTSYNQITCCWIISMVPTKYGAHFILNSNMESSLINSRYQKNRLTFVVSSYYFSLLQI